MRGCCYCSFQDEAHICVTTASWTSCLRSRRSSLLVLLPSLPSTAAAALPLLLSTCATPTAPHLLHRLILLNDQIIILQSQLPVPSRPRVRRSNRTEEAQKDGRVLDVLGQGEAVCAEDHCGRYEVVEGRGGGGWYWKWEQVEVAARSSPSRGPRLHGCHEVCFSATAGL